MWDLTIHPLEDPESLLAQRPVSGSDTICNDPSPPLVDIVHFGPLCIAINLAVFKHVYYGEVSTPL